MTSSTRWRITITANNGSPSTEMEEVQLRPAAGVDAPLTGYPGTASASSSITFSGPEMAADGVVTSSSLWYSDSSTGWWQYDFTTAIDVQEYTIAVADPYEAPRDFTLSYWDGAAFVVADTRTGVDNTQWVADTPKAFTVTVSDGSWAGAVNLGNVDNLGAGFNRTPFGLSATTVPIVPNLSDGSIDLPLLDLSGAMDGALALLPISLVATGAAGVVGTGAIALQQISISGAMDAPLALEALVVSGIAFSGTLAMGDLPLQALDAAGVAIAGNAADGAVLMPSLLAAADTGAAGDAPLLPPDVAAAGYAGLAGNGALLMDKPTLSATASADPLPAEGDALLPLPASDGVMLRGNVADGAGLLLMPTLSADGYGAEIAAGDSTLLALDASGTAVTGALADGNAGLSRMTLAGDASITPPDNMGDGAAILRMMDMTAGAGLAGAMADGAATLSLTTLAATGVVENISQGNAVLPAATLAASAFTVTPGFGDGAADLSVLTLRASLIAGSVSDGAASVPSLTLSAASFADTLAEGNATLAPFAASGAMVFGGAPTDSAGAVLLSAVLVSAAGLSEQLGNGALTLQQPSVAASAYADNVASGTITIGFVALAAAGYADAIATGSLTLSSPDVAATAEAGHIGSASLTVPLVRVDAFGFSDAIGTATLSLPALSLDASGVAGVPDPVFTGVALNTHTRAVSTYDGLAFNSLAEFNGMVLAATASGIVALTGDSDQGQPISAQVTAGISDLGAQQFKRVLAGYVGYQADGALELTMVTDAHHDYVYKLEPRRIDQVHASRVKFGRGVDGRYWQWKLSNRAGAHFALDALSLDVQPLSRRIG